MSLLTAEDYKELIEDLREHEGETERIQATTETTQDNME